MDDKKLLKLKQIPPGKYKHYLGKMYEVVGIALHSETLEEMVIYKALYGQGFTWVRPKKMFVENIIVEGKKVPRFSLVQ